ncbi:Bug family tripartite tricarboxylate transporter substrate binding protein [Ramlibacter rhizophilus]|uniref:Tripartite tricarboxylate transporter substrate binding protein n=1 Tax=Ramlibacter rhizophilus TaxID=1781167 RepID=A0A4Z0C4E3_9BURK|nr:tripartite tricarboxylate transporter substrate-binding protein [Ramlibacter rhizophilus]TFZ04999.1 tripartite tricarboxylate transporter substrate binding protein [Ramlibacter rhizophilus]
MNGPTLMNRRHVLAALVATGSSPLAFGQSAPADYPRQPVKVMLGFPPGGGVDITTRLLAQGLADSTGKTFIVENRPGAGGTLAAGQVAKAEPDGHTLFLMASGHSIAPALYKNLSYDSVGDFSMISMVTRFPFGIAVAGSSPIKSLSELMKMAREKPQSVTMGHAGVGTGMHLAGALLQNRTGVRFTEVPYKGGNLAPMAAAAGEIAAVYDNLAGMDPLIQSGRLRLLAVSSGQRWRTLPDVPTVAEVIGDSYEVMGWTALAGPKGMPAPVVNYLAAETAKVMARQDVIDRLARQGLGAVSSTPAEASRVLASEVARWQKLVREENISVGG